MCVGEVKGNFLAVWIFFEGMRGFDGGGIFLGLKFYVMVQRSRGGMKVPVWWSWACIRWEVGEFFWGKNEMMGW